nr:hypothetical protein [Tanacetum cinerariifolium]
MANTRRSIGDYKLFPMELITLQDLFYSSSPLKIDLYGLGSKTLNFYLGNQRGESLRVTLWGGLGDVLFERKTKHVGISVEPTKAALAANCSQPKEGMLENLLIWARNRKNNVCMFSPVLAEYSTTLSQGIYKSFVFTSSNFPLYMLEVVVADDTTHTVVMMFNDTSTEMIKCLAESLMGADADDDSNLPTTIRKINPSEPVEDDASSSTPTLTADDTVSSMKRLLRHPIVLELEDSDVYELCGLANKKKKMERNYASLNMHQRRWIELFNDYDCKIRYHPEMQQGLDEQLERRSDGALYYMDRIWVPLTGDVRTLIMDEAHKSRYSVHLRANKMYYDLRDMYWWPGMKKDITLYVSKCLTCLNVKAEHQRPSGLLQQREIPEWK